MKSIFTFFVLISLILTPQILANDTKPKEGIIWHKDLNVAFTLAKKEQKNIMLMVEDEFCRWCVKMKKNTLSNTEVKEALHSFILVKVDRNDNKNMESLEGLRGPIPSFHFFTPEKKRIDKIAGYYQSEDFLGYIKEVIEDLE